VATMTTMPKPRLTTQTAEALDAADELAPFRARFALPAPVYLCGHSLGPQPNSARAAVLTHLDKWAEQGVSGHFTAQGAWATLEDAASTPGCAIVGAEPGEVVFMNALTVNLHLMMTAFYTPNIAAGRVEVLVEEHAFPSDEYAVQSHLRARGIDPQIAVVRLRPRVGEHLLREESIIDEIFARAARGSLALVILPGVQYFTGQVLPMANIARACNEVSVPCGLDLAHAVGNIPLSLHDWGVDFAVWCTYKYLNSGPGAVAGAFVHAKHGDCTSKNRLGGWWGQERETRFAMGPDFIPQTGAYGFQISNPPILALAPVIASLELFAEAGGMHVLRKKSVLLTNFLQQQLLERLGSDIEIVSPSESSRRGCQLSIRLRCAPHAAKAVQAELRTRGIVCDVREPDVMRVAPIPLYNSFGDVAVFVAALADILPDLAETSIDVPHDSAESMKAKFIK
jgi:kynureninase